MVETSQCLEFLVDCAKPTLVTGDFNVCFNLNRNNSITNNLEKLGFKQLIRKATQIMGGLIDHAYWIDKPQIWDSPVIDSYSPYYSDHDILLITLKRKEI